jgi:hypothetical protein
MPYHEELVGMTIDDIANFNPNLATLVAVFIRLTRTLFIGVGILLIAVIHYGLRKAERRAWCSTLVGMGAVNAPMVAITKHVSEILPRHWQ